MPPHTARLETQSPRIPEDAVALLDAVAGAVFLLDAETHSVIAVNRSLCEWLDTVPEALVGRPCADAFGFEVEDHDPLSREGRPGQGVARTVTPAQGPPIPVLTFWADIHWSAPPCRACTLVDLRAQTEADARGEQATREWRCTFDSMPDMVSIHDRDCRILRVNRALAETFGLAPQDLVGRRCYDVFHDSHHLHAACPARASLAACAEAEAEFYEPHLGRYVGVRTSPIVDEQGRTVGTVHIARDITEAKQARDALVDLNNRLREADRQKTEFVSVTSHELRTPLAVVLGALKVLQEEVVGPLAPAQQEVVATAQASIRHLSRIVDDLLDVSKIEAGKLALYPAATDMAALVHACTATFAPLAKEHDIALSCRADEATPLIQADADRIRQVLDNLVGNALTFTPASGRVCVTCEPDRDGIHLTVEDSGCGIAAENLPRLFERFAQFGGHPEGRTKGTGLGLTICKGLVEQHGGRIWAESELGHGSVFHVVLPRKPDPPEETDDNGDASGTAAH